MIGAINITGDKPESRAIVLYRYLCGSPFECEFIINLDSKVRLNIESLHSGDTQIFFPPLSFALEKSTRNVQNRVNSLDSELQVLDRQVEELAIVKK